MMITPLELELAIAFQEAAMPKNEARLRELKIVRNPAPLYIEQARVLCHNSSLRHRIRNILDNNQFAGEEER